MLVHAAAGGVSGFLTQWSHHLGATVIGTVGSAEKAAVAKAGGCDHIVLYRETDFVCRDAAALSRRGVAAVFDGVGKDTFLPSLDCLQPFGMLVNFGNASGPPPPLDVRMLSQKGSLSGDARRHGSVHRGAFSAGCRRCRAVRSHRQRHAQGLILIGNTPCGTRRPPTEIWRKRRVTGSLILIP